MQKIIKLLIFLFTSFISFFVFASPAQAVCPVCTAAVIGGLGFSRVIGIDDSVSGIWIGGLILSLTFWTTDWIIKKGYLKKLKQIYILILCAALYYLITFVPMQMTNFIGHPVNRIYGIDKLVFGTVVGSLGFLAGVYLDQKQRKLYGKQFFQFQRVVFPLALLFILSVVLYLIIRP